MKTVEIYADTRGHGKCNGPHCGKPLLWATVVKSGKKMCFTDPQLPALSTRHEESTMRLIEVVDLDNNHWRTCPDRKSF